MNNFESWFLSYFLNSLWQVPVLFAAGWIAARALQKVSTAAEHRVWVGVLLLQSFLPAWPMSSWALPWHGMRATFSWIFTRLFPGGWGAQRAGEAQVRVMMGPGYGVGGINLPAGLLTGIAIAYGAVIAYFAARFVWRWVKLAALRRESEEVRLTGEAAVCWAECAERSG
jgi:hypothetical protein